jgi:hypothetical protein
MAGVEFVMLYSCLSVVPWQLVVLWVGLLYRFLFGFPLINRTTIFFLINRKGKAFASFQKKN